MSLIMTYNPTMGTKSSILIILILLSLFFVLNSQYSNATVLKIKGLKTVHSQNETDRNLAGNATESFFEPFGDPGDITGSQFSSNAKKIAMELTEITPEEVSQYPITNLSSKDISSVFELLNPLDLAKVLLNIPQQDLMKIHVMLSPSAFNKTVDRLLEANRTQVEDRLSSLSP
jgi:hypothetical protein